jgi:hypothetical protein
MSGKHIELGIPRLGPWVRGLARRMAQVRPCNRARPALRCEERNAAPEFVRGCGGGDLSVRTLFPYPPIRFPGSPVSSTLDEINFLSCESASQTEPRLRYLTSTRLRSFRISDQT